MEVKSLKVLIFQKVEPGTISNYRRRDLYVVTIACGNEGQGIEMDVTPLVSVVKHLCIMLKLGNGWNSIFTNCLHYH